VTTAPKGSQPPDQNIYLDLIGYRLGDYVIEDYIDAGGQAVVYKAHLTDYPQRKRALKIFGLLQFGSSGLRVGLKEAKKLAAVDHPAVVRFYPPDVADVDFQGATRRILYLPMDYANQGSCDKNPPFKDRHLSVMDIRSMIELLEGLQAIHEEMIHEDIKPANILQFQTEFDGEERIVLRITDFGIARVGNAAVGMDRDDPSGMTKEFMPPERVDNKHSEKGDIYSMGATLFYMITGVLPIAPPSKELSDPYSSLLGWQEAHKNQPRPNAMKYSVFCHPRLALLIMRMMSTEPNDRPDIEECKKELRRINKTHDLQLFQRLELPKILEEELARSEFPIRYVPEDFRGIFKPKIHESCEARLFVIRIRMGHPVYNQYKVIVEYMISRFSDCFCMYETWGTYDVNILLWGKHDEAGALSLKRKLEERLAGSKVEIRIASKIHDFHCDDPTVPDNADPVHALAVQERKSLPDLEPDKYLCKEFAGEHLEHCIQAFTYVSLVEPMIELYIRNAIIRNVHDKLAELMQKEKSSRGAGRFQRLSMIELLPPRLELAGEDTAVLLVSFVTTGYRYLADLPTAIIGATSEKAVKTSTFLETGRVVIESDKILFESSL
jgi:serine/threonine-protein kinase